MGSTAGSETKNLARCDRRATARESTAQGPLAVGARGDGPFEPTLEGPLAGSVDSSGCTAGALTMSSTSVLALDLGDDLCTVTLAPAP